MGLERVAQRELERARSAGAEELARRTETMIEGWQVDVVVETRVVPVGRAPNVGYVEQVEYFSNRLQGMRLLEMERPREAHVKGVEVVAEVDFLEVGLG